MEKKMKKISYFHSFEYIEKKNFIFYILISILDIILASAMPLITKLMIDSVISGNFKKFFDMILLEVIILLLFLSTQTMENYMLIILLEYQKKCYIMLNIFLAKITIQILN